MKHRTHICGVLTAIASLSFLISRAETPAPPPGFQALFNGEDLSGWRAIDSNRTTGSKSTETQPDPQHWTVENAVLVGDGQGPNLRTVEEFGDFDLRLEFQTAPGADGGIYVRGVPKVQIGDGDQPTGSDGPTARPRFGSGGLIHNPPGTLGQDPLGNHDSAYGAWNKIRIQQVGTRIWVNVNNHDVVPGVVMENSLNPGNPFPARGPIVFEANGGPIRWRNIVIREMEAVEAERFLVRHPPVPEPTAFDVAYGPHAKQVFHFWKAESDAPTPVLFYIHGGGWLVGNRGVGLMPMLTKMLDAGISVASIEYRFIPEATADGVVPPVKGPLHDAARALQMLRSKAGEWNIDKQRIGASGGSAGACSSLWLAFHPDMADPESNDPVARESTRLWCAAVAGAQTTLDPQQMKEWTPNSRYGGHAFGLGSFENFHAKRESILPWIAEFSPYALVSPDDPPIYLSYWTQPALGQLEKDPTHTANFGVKLAEHCENVGVECELVYPDAPNVQHATTTDYLLWALKRGASEAPND